MNTLRTLAVLALMTPLAALAHSHLESSQPAKDSTVAASPARVMLMFSDAVDLTALELQKKGDAAKTKLAPLPAKMSNHVMVPLPKLGDGEYVLTYKVVSTDMHESTGSITFKVDARAK